MLGSILSILKASLALKLAGSYPGYVIQDQAYQEGLSSGMHWETEKEKREQGDYSQQEAHPFVLKRKSKMVPGLRMQSLQLAFEVRTKGLSFADLHRAREKQPATFTLLCKDAAGDSMGRGGDNIQVAVVPKDKKDRFVLHRCHG